jgi:hypothetical protein
VVGAARNRSFSPQARRGGWTVVRVGEYGLPGCKYKRLKLGGGKHTTVQVSETDLVAKATGSRA